MSSNDPKPPRWVAPDMHGFRARLGRHAEGSRALVATVSTAMFMLWMLIATLLALVLFILVIEGGAWLMVLGMLVALMLPAALVGWILRRWFSDHVFEVTLHSFRYNDTRGRYWSLPLSALTHAEAEDGWLVVHRDRAEPLRFRGRGVTDYELRLFAWYLSMHIREHGVAVEAPPEELRNMRAGQQAARQPQ